MQRIHPVLEYLEIPEYLSKVDAIVSTAREGDPYAQYICLKTNIAFTLEKSVQKVPDSIHRYFLEILAHQAISSNDLSRYLPILEVKKNKSEQSKFTKLDFEFRRMFFIAFTFRGLLNKGRELKGSESKGMEWVLDTIKPDNPKSYPVEPLCEISEIDSHHKSKQHYKSHFKRWKLIFEALNFLPGYSAIGGFPLPSDYSKGGGKILQVKQARGHIKL